MGWNDDWAARGACRTTDPDALFVQGAAQNRAKVVCSGCPVRAECLADALDNRTEFGVWGGMTERERRALLRRSPQVTSWKSVLQEAQRSFEESYSEASMAGAQVDLAGTVARGGAGTITIPRQRTA